MASTVQTVIPSADPAYTALLLFAEDPADMPHCKLVELRPNVRVPIGRVTSSKNHALPGNCYFDARVLSRKHGEIWADSSARVFICDTGSSNGTFVNDQRLSPDNTRSDNRQLNNSDKIEFGVNIYDNDDQEIIHRKVTVRAKILPANSDPTSRKRFFSCVDEYFSASLKLASPRMSRSNSSNPAANHKLLMEQVQAQLAKNRQFTNEFSKLQREVSSIRNDPAAILKVRKGVADLERDQVAARHQIDSMLDLASRSRQSDDPALVAQLELLSAANKVLIADVSGLEKRIKELDPASSRGWNECNLAEKSGSSNSFLIFVSILVALLAALYYVCTNPAVEEKLAQFSVKHMNFDPTDALDYIKRLASDAVKEAHIVVDQLKNSLFPRVEG